MTKRAVFTKTARFFKTVYLKFFRINDSPQKIALGFGLGVFLGVMPGAGPIIALLLAIMLKINRASALLGSVLTNTWLSIPVFFLAAKAGSIIAGVSYKDIRDGWSLLLNDFSWVRLFKISIHVVLAPIAIGYILVSLCMAAFAYIFVLIIVNNMKNKKRAAGTLL